MRPRSGLVIGLGLLALGVLPAASSAATIDFEGLTPGTTVNAQFAGDGVTFNGPTAQNYSGIPGFAHSGTHGIELCYAAEQCTSKLRVDFTSGQTTVGAWVGFNSTGVPSSAIPVRLTALDGSDNVVGVADGTIPAGTNSPINTHLQVTGPSATIRAFTLGQRPDGSVNNGIAIDDVEYSTAGPPPSCPATAPPSIGLTSPTQGSVLQNNQILLEGSVDNHGAPITAATVVSDGDTVRTAIGFPSPIGPAGGDFAINMNGLLQLGNQKVFVTATNCAGTGASGNPALAYSPLPATAGFTQLAPVEVSQAVQSPFNPVPLIARGPNGTKRTVARAFFGAEGVTSPITGVSGRLTATRPDGSRPGGPLTVDSLNTISVAPNQTLEGARASLNTSLNFELPPEWLSEGRLHLQLEQLKIEGAQTTRDCENCDNWGGIPATVSFHRVPPVRVWLVGVPYTGVLSAGGAPQTISPRQKDFDFLTSWLRRAYPTAEVQVTQATMPTQSRLPGDCHDLNDDLSDWASTMPSQPSQTRYYGVVSDRGGFMRGCGSIGGRFGSGPAGASSFGWDNDGTYADWYGGHEIGHMFDRHHPNGGCDDSDDDDSFPYVGGAIGNFTFDNQGLDVGDSSLPSNTPMALYDWRAGWHDVMTYCEQQWVSSYTYNGILRNLCGNDKPNCPDNAALSKGVRPKKSGGPRLAINGTLDLDKGKARLDPMSALAGLTLTDRPKDSRYSIVERGAGGRRVGTYPFEPKEVSDLPAGRRLASINEVVPFSAKARRIEIKKGKRVLASTPVSAHAPLVKLRSSKAKKLRKPATLRWTARDADGGKLLSTVQYAANGKRFMTLAAGLRKRSLKVDPSHLPGGKRARFRVVVTDGVLTGIDSSKPFKVKVKRPSIAIRTPVDGAKLAEGQSVQLAASVRDDQDVRLDRRVTWSSDAQGELGRGALLTAALTPGTHRITATVTNSGEKTATASITVEVEATPPTVDAQLVP